MLVMAASNAKPPRVRARRSGLGGCIGSGEEEDGRQAKAAGGARYQRQAVGHGVLLRCPACWVNRGRRGPSRRSRHDGPSRRP